MISGDATVIIDGEESSFDTFEEAIGAANAASSTPVLRLSRPVTVSSLLNISRDMRLDLGGQVLSRDNGGSVLTVKDGATLTINGKKVGSGIMGRINLGVAPNNNGSIVINGGTYECANGDTCLHINGTCTNSNVTIMNADIYSPTDNGIQLNGAGTFTLENSTIKGATGVYIKSGTTTIRNCEITGTMEPANYDYNGNGANATGDGIVIDSCDYPGGTPVVTLAGSNTVIGTKSAIGLYEYDGNKDGVMTPSVVTSDRNTYALPSGFIWEKTGNVYKAVHSA